MGPDSVIFVPGSCTKLVGINSCILIPELTPGAELYENGD